MQRSIPVCIPTLLDLTRIVTMSVPHSVVHATQFVKPDEKESGKTPAVEAAVKGMVSCLYVFNGEHSCSVTCRTMSTYDVTHARR